jgi:hypothetical protein
VDMKPTSGFRTRASKYWIGLAPSNRAKCRSCKQVVEKGEVRIVTLAFVRPGHSCKLVIHARCATAAIARAMRDACGGDVERVPMAKEVSVEVCREVRARLLSLSAA